MHGILAQAIALRERIHTGQQALLKQSPESAQAARDALVSLERLAAAVGDKPEGAVRGLDLQGRALEIALRLRQANSDAYTGRAAAVSFFLTYQRAMAAGQGELANRYLIGCHQVLGEMVARGMLLDAPMQRLFGDLNAALAQGDPRA